jgi:hypothetical protein
MIINTNRKVISESILINLVVLDTIIHKRIAFIYIYIYIYHHVYLAQYLHIFYKIIHKRTLHIYFIYIKYLAQNESLLGCFLVQPPNFSRWSAIAKQLPG